MSITVRQNLVDPSKYGVKCPHAMTPYYLTIHNTANDASADAEIRYMISNNNQVSFHFAVDGTEVVQGLPLDRNGWHAGDGNGEGNRKSIAIEICYSRSGGERYVAAENMAIVFIAGLLRERNWGVDRLRQHANWSNKNCPHRIRDEGRWDEFVNRIANILNGNNGGSGAINNNAGGVSIVDYLNSIGQDSSFANRSRLASQHGISNYTGTAEQNLQLLNILRNQTAAPPQQNVYSGHSLIDYLKSVGQDSSFTNRKRLAEHHGIGNYTGTANQNTTLLRKMRGF